MSYSCVSYWRCLCVYIMLFVSFFMQDLLKVYKETRNGMLGPDYSTKFSPWLAFGCISPRFIYEEVNSFKTVIRYPKTYSSLSLM